QKENSKIIYTQNGFTENDIINNFTHRLRLPAETKSFEITGLTPSGTLFFLGDFADVLADPEKELPYHALPDAEQPQYRLIEHIQSTYFSDDLRTELPVYTLSALGLPYQSYQLAYTPELLAA